MSNPYTIHDRIEALLGQATKLEADIDVIIERLNKEMTPFINNPPSLAMKLHRLQVAAAFMRTGKLPLTPPEN